MASKTHKADRSNEKSERQQKPKPLVFAFVVLNVFVIALFSIPVGGWGINGVRELFAPYMRCIGMTEQWDMFAPKPISTELYLKAVVQTKSGHQDIYSFPRMEDLSYLERYRKERYRKFSEGILCGDCAGLWPDIERRVARQVANPADPPYGVAFVKFESPIDPKKGLTGDDVHAKATVLSELAIEPEDMR